MASGRRTARFAVSISASLTAGLTMSLDMGKAKAFSSLELQNRFFKENHGFSARCPAFFFRNLTCLKKSKFRQAIAFLQSSQSLG